MELNIIEKLYSVVSFVYSTRQTASTSSLTIDSCSGHSKPKNGKENEGRRGGCFISGSMSWKSPSKPPDLKPRLHVSLITEELHNICGTNRYVNIDWFPGTVDFTSHKHLVQRRGFLSKKIGDLDSKVFYFLM